MTVKSKNVNFEISGKIVNGKLSLIMKVNDQKYINTKNLLKTHNILHKNLPSIFSCECFNGENKSFGQECLNTELGHLFEHIMLEYLCIAKLDSGEDAAIYEGVTNWNWEKEIPGTFNIEINGGLKDIKIVKKAFNNSVSLLTEILIN